MPLDLALNQAMHGLKEKTVFPQKYGGRGGSRKFLLKGLFIRHKTL